MGDLKTIILGGGCFWCTEAVFSSLKGIVSVMPGYAGGEVENPTYEQVCGGGTGHAEVVKLEYDEERINLEKILDMFFESHDPTSLNRQGGDIGTQYRSAIYFTDNSQKEIIENFIKEKQKEYSKPIVTEVKSLDKFYEAEEYHHEYFKKNPDKAYCQLVIAPKIKKVNQKFDL